MSTMASNEELMDTWGVEQMLYVYRYPDGRTQVRAPHINDPALVIDMLEQALEAMHNGSKVETQ